MHPPKRHRRLRSCRRRPAAPTALKSRAAPSCSPFQPPRSIAAASDGAELAASSTASGRDARLPAQSLGFNGAQENLEKSTQSLEQTFATGGAGCARSRTGSPYEGESLSLQYAHHLAELRQGVVDENRRNELTDTQFEIEKARKAAELAERKAATLAANASADQLRKEIELENARRTMNEVRGHRRETGFDGDTADDDDPPAFRAALACERERQTITRARDRKLKAILDTVGGDESKLTGEQIGTMEAIKEASLRAERAFDLEQATGAIFPEGDEEQSR